MLAYIDTNEITKDNIIDVLSEISSDLLGIRGMLEALADSGADSLGGASVPAQSLNIASDSLYVAYTALSSCVPLVSDAVAASL